MGRILFVEDDLELQCAIPRLFGSECVFKAVSSLAEARRCLAVNTYDLVLLDLELPDGDSLNLCAAIRNDERFRGIPIIFLTGNATVEEKVTAFSLGADDYIVKPFDPRELRARIMAKLEKASERQKRAETFVKGDLRFSLPTQRVYLIRKNGDVQLELTSLEFKLLVYFTRNTEHVLTRDQLIEAVWGNNVHVIDRTVDAHVSNLRKKLTESASKIKSVHGEGYRFVLTSK